MADSPKGDLYKAVKHPRMRPWLAVAAELPATFAAHHAWGDSPLAAAGLTVAAGVLTAATWWGGEGTKKARRIHATLSTAAGTTYLVIGTVTDPLDPTLLSTLAIGGAVAAGSWNVRQALRINPDTKDGQTAAVETGVLVKAIGQAKAQLRGQPKVEPNKVTVPLQLAGGQISTDELANRSKHIAGELGVSPNSIRIQADPDRADRADLIIVPQDMLKQPSDWPGPSRLGGSITDPIVIGVYEDGAEAVLWFPAGPGRNATHFLTAGMNGSGKSAGQSVAITEALTRRDVIVWAIDPSKGMQTFAPFLPYLDWVEMTTAGGEAMIDALSQVITARANEMGRHGYKNWTPEVYAELGMPYMVVWIEEAAKFFRNGTEMEGLVMEARSAGISVIISLQRPSATSMPTDVREQLGGVICFGVKGSTTADMALPDDVRDAGARPEAWENRRPGYAYLVAPGVDEERYPTPLRTYRIDDDQISGALAIAPRPTADPVTAAAAGDAYANRTHYTPDSPLTSTDNQPQQIVTSSEEQTVDDEQLLNRQAERDIFATAQVAGIDTDGLIDADPDKEIPPAAQVWTFAQPQTGEVREMTPQEAEAELLAILEEFRQQGMDTVGPRHFQPFWGEGNRLPRSRAWVSGKLNDLADAGIHLKETDDIGVYRLLDPVPAAV
ncbi:plasmid transfer protein TraB [Streptomyces viridodiastaticus]|uniref:plasmid transfer protein TraB n=1 Tax=Streptomyces albogriseolus TaxID=1887 RepID=UPI00224ED5DD|nr:plasmid transfer protein TraB [Streptomyces viridodiastaticus]MCX4571624.1 plasmid transfer protein TraB [Streptomyces viridodiastaticus]